MFKVETEMLGTWENCWSTDNGQPEVFLTKEAAVDAIKDHICDCINAVEAGDMLDSPDPDHFRIIGPDGTKYCYTGKPWEYLPQGVL